MVKFSELFQPRRKSRIGPEPRPEPWEWVVFAGALVGISAAFLLWQAARTDTDLGLYHWPLVVAAIVGNVCSIISLRRNGNL